MTAGIVLLGLGPGDPHLLTREAWEVLAQADEVYLRTAQHPTVAGFPPGLRVRAFDDLYEQLDDFPAVYRAIVERVLALGRRPQGVVYAVPGHPLMAEATGREIARQARREGIPLRVVHGVSFLEPVCAALGVDPFPHTALVDAMELSMLHVPPFPPAHPAIIAQLYDRQVAGEVKITLMAHYPDEHPVALVHAAGTSEEVVERVPLYQIDRSEHIGLLTALYLPPLAPESSFEAFQEVVARLRAPDGCPWDRQQTHRSLRPYLLEEAYETLAALDADDPNALREELGDLLLQIVLHAQIAAEQGEFTMREVLETVHRKMVHRHPHVFGEVQVAGSEEVLQNWARLKAAERVENGQAAQGMLASVALTLPALAQAEAYQARAARVGFDWPDIAPVWDKVQEELAEVREAADADARAAEVGDLLFAVVNLARWLKVDPESALREANARFRRRFEHIEATARRQGRALDDLTLEEMDALWEEAKRKPDP